MAFNSAFATRQELAVMFGMLLPAVVHITKGMNPDDQTANKRARFNIREFAEKAVAPSLDEEVIKKLMRMRPDELPDKLRTAFWSAALKQQEFDARAKDLWPTTEIVEYMGEAFKVLRLSLQLMPDSIEREARMTDLQRKVVQDIIDVTLEEMRGKMVNAFKNRRKSTERGQTPRKKDEGDFGL